MSDPWAVLGVSREASVDEIRAAYRRIALRWHPDRNQGCQEASGKFKEASSALQAVLAAKNRPDFGFGKTRSQGSYSRPSHNRQTSSGAFRGFDSTSASFSDKAARANLRRRGSRMPYAQLNLGVGIACSLVFLVTALNFSEEAWNFHNRGKSFEEVHARLQRAAESTSAHRKRRVAADSESRSNERTQDASQE